MKPLLVAMSSCAYGEERSTRESAPLVAIDVRALWRLCGMGIWRPVRYGESCEAWRSFEVIVCQNDWKKEPTLAAVSTAPARNRNRYSELLGVGTCLTVVPWCQREKGSAERGEAGCALRWEDANKSPQESVVLVGERRRCRERVCVRERVQD